MKDYRALWPSKERTKRLACVTMARDEEFFIEMYIKHYLRQESDVDFYIIDHSSRRPVADLVREKFPDLQEGRVNVTRIPLIPFDDDYKSMALSSIGSIACGAYDIVIVSDADELVTAVEGGLVETCLSIPADVIAPLGFEVVQNRKCEAPYDLNSPVYPQRRHGYFKASETKPVIWKLATLVGPGIHKCLYPYEITERIMLTHMRFADFDQAQSRVNHRRNVEFSKNQIDRKYGTYWAAPELARMQFFLEIEKSVLEDAEEVMMSFQRTVSESLHKNPQGYYGTDLTLQSKYCCFK